MRARPARRRGVEDAISASGVIVIVIVVTDSSLGSIRFVLAAQAPPASTRRVWGHSASYLLQLPGHSAPAAPSGPRARCTAGEVNTTAADLRPVLRVLARVCGEGVRLLASRDPAE